MTLASQSAVTRSSFAFTSAVRMLSTPALVSGFTTGSRSVRRARIQATTLSASPSTTVTLTISRPPSPIFVPVCDTPFSSIPLTVLGGLFGS